MHPSRILLPLAAGAACYWVLPRAISWCMSPPAPAVVLTPASQIRPLQGDPDALVSQTRDSSDAEKEALRKLIQKDPGNATARAKLMAITMFDRSGGLDRSIHNEQAVWFVANLPDSPVLGNSALVNVDRFSNLRTYNLLCELYDKAIVARPKNVAILVNYAALTLVGDGPRAIALLNMAIRLEPKNPILFSKRAFAHVLASRGIFNRSDKAESALAVDDYIRARDLGGEFGGKFFLDAAFDAGRYNFVEGEAKSLIKAHNDADNVNAANTVLGRIALKRNDVPAAKKYLLASAEVSGSPVLGSFGPEMTLAQELLSRGERATVLQFLKSIGKFWSDDRQIRWTHQLENGETPDWN